MYIIYIINMQGTSYLRIWNVYQEKAFKKVTNSRLYVLLLLNDERNTFVFLIYPEAQFMVSLYK
jgi:hypothetical protein